ncbi:Rossmann-fold NAD(P)-binding domain-containing protein [Sedimentitalea nanhaiensis]|uniref:dTDP-4-dehydrorhamnose reductase n=1 Tax=Sedimentitalea nanhaiensis TaxID=999627 RepID=A0A1I7DU30_9RHOB|nr:sugar nucleotide-binding protein [Sedimentitalea nanhaiensis]SFU15116.1 dTDP-4-dehydrorhamnose reductase [Sedimentitalea nanhaiensis]
MTQRVLILGATGRFGRNAALQFRAAGWDVRCFDRSSDVLMQAARGIDVIVNAWNPAYPDWAAQVPGLHDMVIKAALAHDATVIVPGNVYVYGADTPVPWGPDAPHQAQNPLGRIRIAMEDAYRSAGVRTIILRAGDYLDTQASGNWFDKVLTKSLAKGVFTYPGRSDIPHAWAYLPDVARAAVDLAEMRARLPRFNDIAFAGYTLSGQDMAKALDRITPQQVRLKPMAWLPLHLTRPFWRMAGCLLEMRYLWNTPHWLDGSRFDRLLPGFQPTSLHTALASAIGQPSVEIQIDPDQTVAACSDGI